MFTIALCNVGRTPRSLFSDARMDDVIRYIKTFVQKEGNSEWRRVITKIAEFYRALFSDARMDYSLHKIIWENSNLYVYF